MNFSIFLIGILIFFACLLFPIVMWRWRYPKKHIVVLFLIFIMLPLAFVIGYIGLELLGFLPSMVNTIFSPMMDWVAIYLLNLALSCIYLKLLCNRGSTSVACDIIDGR